MSVYLTAVESDVDIGSEAGRHRLRLLGELDRSTAPVLEAEIEELCAEGVSAITLDLDELSYIDWTGAMVIAFRAGWCLAQGIDFTVTPGPPAVQRMFEQTGVGARISFSAGEQRCASPTRGNVSPIRSARLDSVRRG